MDRQVAPHGKQARYCVTVKLGEEALVLNGLLAEPVPNKGIELTGNNVRSCLAPAVPSSSCPAFGNSSFTSKGNAYMHQVNLAAKLATFTEHCQPRTVTQFNGHDSIVVKAQGEFVWHKHDDTDDFFLVLQGHLTIELRDRHVQLGPGELFVVPKGGEHRPVAHEEVHLLLIESAGTPNTGNAATAAARRVISWLSANSQL